MAIRDDALCLRALQAERLEVRQQIGNNRREYPKTANKINRSQREFLDDKLSPTIRLLTDRIIAYYEIKR
jgi:hypothetical protein